VEFRFDPQEHFLQVSLRSDEISFIVTNGLKHRRIAGLLIFFFLGGGKRKIRTVLYRVACEGEFIK
jgi:hypothetical protein